MKKLIVLFLLSCAVSGGVADAATYYVSKSGSDSNSCAQAQTATTSKLTVNAGISCLSAGSTLLVRAGSYNEAIVSTPSGTSWSNKVRIANYPNETVWLKPTTINESRNVIWLDGPFHFVEFDGINVDGTAAAAAILWTSTNNGNDPHHIRFQNAEVIAGAVSGAGAINLGEHALIGATGSNEVINVVIHGGGTTGLCGYQCSSYGIYIKGPNNLVENCDIYDTSGAGMQIYNATGDSPDGNIIRNNRIHDITRTGSYDQVWGILAASGSNNQIYNNLIYGINVGNANSGNAGIAVSGDSNKVWNNTIVNNRNTGIIVGSGASRTEVKNNIVYGSTGSNFINSGSGTVLSNNLLDVDPLFVNQSGKDFQLQAASPAVNAGSSLTFVTTDLNGVVRPQGSGPDIGAYEYRSGQSSSQPAAPVNLKIVATAAP
ncbi:MAG: right-handed parallel beta-helix repeat-containing protein [Acidobacteriota bacterium]